MTATQSRKFSLIETLTSTAIGLIVSFVLGWYLYPALGHKFTFVENSISTAIFTVASVIRGYYVRRFYNWIHNATH